MQTRVSWMVLVAALAAAGAQGAGFEGLRPDGPNAEKAQAGKLDALDPGRRTLQIGGNHFEAPSEAAVDFAKLAVGTRVVVRYREEGDRLIVTRVEVK